MSGYPIINFNNLFFVLHMAKGINSNKNGIKGLWGDKGRPSLGPGPALVLQWTLPWPYNTPNMALYILAIVLHSMQQKWDQGTLGTQSSTLIGSRTRLGPSMGPAMALQYTKHGLLYFGYILHYMQQKWDHGTLGVFRAMLGVLRTMAGSIEGPRRVLDPMRGDLCVPRVP